MLHRQSLSFITHFLRAYPRRTALMVALLACAGVAEGISILTLLPLVELAANPQARPQGEIAEVVFRIFGALGITPTLGTLLIFVVVAMTAKGGLLWLSIKQVGYMVAQVATDLRLQLIRALMATRWSYFLSRPTGRFANAISTEAQRTSWAYRHACESLAALLQLIIYLGVVAVVSWKVAALTLLAGGALVLVLRAFVRMSRAAGQNQTAMMKSLVTRLTEVLPGIKSVKAMAREEELWPLLEREAEDINKARRSAVLAEGSLRSFQEPVFVLLIALGLYASVSLGGMPFATVLVLVILFYRAMTVLGQLQTSYQSATTQESAFHSLQQEIEQAMEAREEVQGQQPPPQLVQDLRLEEVTFAYDQHPVLDGVSLRIPAGSFVTLTGPSGAGKTTLIDLLTGLLHPQQGAVLVDGVPLAQIDLKAWRRQVGYVPQEVLLFQESIHQNVALGHKDVSREDVRWALEMAEALSFVEALPQGIDQVVGPRGATLSGGQRQRIAIARALVGRPRLLILDEATTALDPEVEAAVCAALHRLQGEVTLVAISHQAALREAADVVYEVTGRRVRRIAFPDSIRRSSGRSQAASLR